jgi:hypothetical protein
MPEIEVAAEHDFDGKEPAESWLDDLGPRMRALNPRHRTFVIAYLAVANATEAARLAGYTEGTASSEADGRGMGAGLRVTAARLKKRPDIAAGIREEARRQVMLTLPRDYPTIREMAHCGTAGGKRIKAKDQLEALIFLIELPRLLDDIEKKGDRM